VRRLLLWPPAGRRERFGTVPRVGEPDHRGFPRGRLPDTGLSRPAEPLTAATDELLELYDRHTRHTRQHARS
jgi:hypothetical protein